MTPPATADAELIEFVCKTLDSSGNSNDSHVASSIRALLSTVAGMQAENEKLKLLLSATIRDEHEREREALKQARLSVAATVADMRKALEDVKRELSPAKDIFVGRNAIAIIDTAIKGTEK